MQILSFDIGGTHLKASIVDEHGQLTTDKVSVDSPYPCAPEKMVSELSKLARQLPAHDRIAIGFPGVVRHNRVLTAPHWQDESAGWPGFALAEALSRALGGDALMINDAEMQGLAVIKGKGLELVLTLGTGAGTGLFREGAIMPHMELAHHPIHGDKTYNAYVGDEALKKAGRKRWNKRVGKVIDILFDLLHYDHLFIGGGNATKITFDLPKNVSTVSNEAGIAGAAALWHLADGAR
jgi:polyphosphate glucokinase